MQVFHSILQKKNKIIEYDNYNYNYYDRYLINWSVSTHTH